MWKAASVTQFSLACNMFITQLWWMLRAKKKQKQQKKKKTEVTAGDGKEI